MPPIRRRTMLGGAAAIAASSAAWRRYARADSSNSTVRRVLILNAPGGLRSSAAFNASSDPNFNPWGVAGTFGSMKLGNVLTLPNDTITHDASLWPDMEVPSIDAIADQLALIGAADHAPDGSYRVGDHTDDEPRMATGYWGKLDAPGLLTVINRVLGNDAAAPVTNIDGATLFGIAPGEWLAYAPIALTAYEMPDRPPNSGMAGVGRLIEDDLDSRYLAGRRAQARSILDAYRGTKSALRKFGPLLADPALNLYADPAAEVGGITNEMLNQLAGVEQVYSQSLGLVMRLLQVGSPAVALNFEAFDWHDHENTEGPRSYPRFARFLAGIHFGLSNIPDPAGDGSLLDSTLVVTTSEFGRGAPEGGGGFSQANGTDHGASGGPGWRYQAHVVFGGGVRPKLIAPTNSSNEPTGALVSTQSLLATIACAVGVPVDMVESLWPSGTALYPEGGPLWELWD